MHQRQILAERQRLIRRAAELEPGNDDKIDGLAEAQASAAQALARLDGAAPNSPEEADAQANARSQILRAAIEQRIGSAMPDKAVTLYDRVKASLSPADRRALALPLGVATDEATTDAWLARETGKDGAPLADRAGVDDTLTDQQRLILRAKIGARDSAEESRRFATVKGLDDQLAAATATLATQPALYRPGTLAQLAESYADAGAPEKADETRRLALQENYFRTLAQAGAAVQQRHLDDLTGPERAMAEAIVRHQTDTFASDPYAAGTALYPEVRPPLPAEDAEGRLRQMRMIEAMRDIPPSDVATVPTANVQPASAPSISADQPEPDRVWTDGQASHVVDPNLVLAADEPTNSPPSDNSEPQDGVELAQAKPQQTRASKAQQNQQKLQKWAEIPAAKQRDKGPLPADWKTRLTPTALDALYREAATYKVPPEMLAPMIWMESGFKERAGAGSKKEGQGLIGVGNNAINELIRQNAKNPDRLAQLQKWQTGDARLEAEPAISMTAEYLRFLFDKFGQSWVNAAVAYKSGEGRLRPFLRGERSDLDNETVEIRKGKKIPGEGLLAKGYLSVVFDGNPNRFDSYR